MTLGFLIPLLAFVGVFALLAHIQVIKPFLKRYREMQQQRELFRAIVGLDPALQADQIARGQIQTKVHCRMGMYAIQMHAFRKRIKDLRPVAKGDVNPFNETKKRILSLQSRIERVEDKASLLPKVAGTFLYITYQLDNYVQNALRLHSQKKLMDHDVRRKLRDQKRAAALRKQEQTAPPPAPAPAETAPAAEQPLSPPIEIPAVAAAETPTPTEGENQVVH